MENLRLREAASTAVNVTVGKRSREYLTDREVERLIEAAKQNRSGHRDATAILVAYRHDRDATAILVAYRHGFRASGEVERLIEAAKQNRSGHRDATAILVAYRHGFRGLEAGGTALGRRRPRHWALACTQGQEHSKTSGRINFP